MNNNDSNQTSPHILNTSSNLLGLCFLVLTSIRLLDVSGKTIIDEVVSVAALAFMVSSILSFLSIKSHKELKSRRLEDVADYFFMGGLCTLFLVIVVITFQFMK
ncbi:hypothetical protein SY85_09440 [Flavisolibacter tropicus]|uniref:Uncharacterized protein n=1 Tax=Flavisolibacter tropicus TaxID=1492898 RepID=A0A172TUL8_9BACT|nr:hypothetical protein SY85_09440 [Flavisolibacter tropicus]